ncbi:MAG TPA: branched-chain amino acid ABC transporter permease [Candidatus Marinimicrobia bacterium]|jgi:branched-chain amino acid transport system permease protein|nr:branched-chain amino acid ABC transporter permease [Candidatus Neomarinimicrobiota bacterium]PCJ47334.1 MAG: branched-chain amino acid ABC transporter permease [Candidatus Neomarinimicrobiota bacterium]HIA84189.1 branched-chain amino acid ABC transporter permease [Candidatus Neomarinimicrobiota bacterium]HIB78959.1 branched-chain amino acid ABC transporter permease [Candidatus Neomarinimicrobiota bacterium]HIM73935.1 branched-chain amino acid ABC transporter permease [Candidatus Neomarinimic
MTSFFTDIGQEIVSGIALGSIYALIALGFILIYKATEVVNFAQGELMMVGAYVNFFLIQTFTGSLGVPTIWTFLFGLLGSIIFAVIFGWFLDLIINRPMRDEPVFSIIMATISIGIVLRALVGLIAGPMSLVPPSPFGGAYIKLGGIIISVLDIFIIGSAIVLVSVFYYFFNKTRWGLAMQATSEDPIAAELMGVPVTRVYTLVWIFAAIVAAVSGVLLAPRVTILDTNIGFLGLKAFPAAVLGGFGSIPGAIVGGVILGVIETISMGTLSFHFSWVKEINDIIVWIVLIAVLMIRPTGIMGKEEIKKV